MINESTAEAQSLNKSFEFGQAEQQILKPLAMVPDSGTAVIHKSCLCSVKLIHKFPKCVFEKLYFFCFLYPWLENKFTIIKLDSGTTSTLMLCFFWTNLRSGPILFLFKKIKERRAWSQATVETNTINYYNYWVRHAEVALEAKPF